MRQQAKLSLSSQVRCKGNTVADTQPIRLEITTADKGRGRRICPGSAMRLSPGSGSNGIPCIHVHLTVYICIVTCKPQKQNPKFAAGGFWLRVSDLNTTLFAFSVCGTLH